MTYTYNEIDLQLTMFCNSYGCSKPQSTSNHDFHRIQFGAWLFCKSDGLPNKPAFYFKVEIDQRSETIMPPITLKIFGDRAHIIKLKELQFYSLDSLIDSLKFYAKLF